MLLLLQYGGMSTYDHFEINDWKLKISTASNVFSQRNTQNNPYDGIRFYFQKDYVLTCKEHWQKTHTTMWQIWKSSEDSFLHI